MNGDDGGRVGVRHLQVDDLVAGYVRGLPVVHGVSIEGSEVVVDVTQHGPGDPACCPTQRVSRRFRYADGRLIDTAPPPKETVPAGDETSR